MKLPLVLLFIIFFQGCSFDTKTGIWKNENSTNETIDKKRGSFEGFQKLSTETDTFDKVIKITSKLNLKLNKSLTVNKWEDVFFLKSNNSLNFNYNNLNKIIFKSRKLTKSKINDHILFSENRLITSDEKGNLIIFLIKKIK